MKIFGTFLDDQMQFHAIRNTMFDQYNFYDSILTDIDARICLIKVP